MNPEVQAEFEKDGVDFIKGPPSATGIHQANDRSTCFRDVKKGMKRITKNNTIISNNTLKRHVKDPIDTLKRNHKEVVLSSVNESKIIKAIETLTYVQKNCWVQARKHVDNLYSFDNL